MMALYEDGGFAAKCVMMEKKRLPDGAGGWLPTAWAEGAEFTVYKYMQSSAEVRIAEQNGFTSVYRAWVDKDTPLERNDVFKDTETGVTYRVTSDPADEKAPDMSTLNYKAFSAERYTLPA